MADLNQENIIKGLYQHCEGSMFDRCGECPYYEIADEHFQCEDALLMDALKLIKEQKRVIDAYHKADTFLAVHGWKWR